MIQSKTEDQIEYDDKVERLYKQFVNNGIPDVKSITNLTTKIPFSTSLLVVNYDSTKRKFMDLIG